MLKLVTFCLIVLFFAGCVTAPKKQSSVLSVVPSPVETGGSSEPAVVQPPDSAEPGHAFVGQVSTVLTPAAAKKPRVGFVFGKTDFQGLLKAPYVRLLIRSRDDQSRQYDLFVGSRENQSVVPWGEERVVEPGYFVLRLPPGNYRITEVAIPVGSALAEENMALDFNVVAGEICYVGTLELNGVKERVKFGGVPLVRPGFIYNLSVHDDFSEAMGQVQTFLSDVNLPLKKRLFSVIYTTNGDIPSAGSLKPGEEK